MGDFHFEVTPAAYEMLLQNFRREVPKIGAVGGWTSDAEPGYRLAVAPGGCAGFQYELSIVEKPIPDQDTVVDYRQLLFFVDEWSQPLLNGMTIDFNALRGFLFNNPNATGGCGCNQSFSV